MKQTAAVLAAIVVMTAGQAAAQPADPSFSAMEDAAIVERCFGAYMTLSRSVQALQPPQTAHDLDLRAYRGAQRIRPFNERVRAAVGDDAFYSASVQSHATENDALGLAPVNAARDAIAQRLAAEAARCDAQLTAWGAPPFTGSPPDEQLAGHR